MVQQVGKQPEVRALVEGGLGLGADGPVVVTAQHSAGGTEEGVQHADLGSISVGGICSIFATLCQQEKHIRNAFVIMNCVKPFD